MRMIFKCVFFITLLMSVSLGCSKKQEPPPAQAPAAATGTAPAPQAVQPPAPAPGFDGEWSGKSGEDLPISFTIRDNQVTSLSASYSGQNGSCSYNGSFSSDGPSSIQDKSFTAKGHGSRDPIEFTAKGTLNSPTEASGTLVWTGKSELCGNINLNYQWTAKKAPPQAEESADLLD